MKRLILPFMFTLAAAPVVAQNINIYIPREGGGVTQTTGSVTVQEAAEIMRVGTPPEGVTGIVLEPGKPPRWSNLPPELVIETLNNEAFAPTDIEIFAFSETDGDEMTFDDPSGGGSGEETAGDRMTFDDPSDNPENDEMTFDDPVDDEDPPTPNPTPEPEPSPEPLPTDDGDTSAATIEPRAGNWFGDVLEQNFEGCPPSLEGPVRAQAARLSMSTIQGEIDPSFTPHRIATEFDWTKTGANEWIGTLDQLTEGLGVRVQWAVKIESPVLIENRQQLNFEFGPLGSCEVYTRAVYVWMN